MHVIEYYVSFNNHSFSNLPGSLPLVITHCNNIDVVLYLNINLEVQFETAVLTGQWSCTKSSGLVTNIKVCR